MPAEPSPAVYAIADTHLGLRDESQEPHRDDPVVVADFLRWLAALPAKGLTIPTWDGDEVVDRALRPASHLLLLGDIVELWDSEQDAVVASAGSVASALADVRAAEKVYLLGNHDDVLARIAGSYPLGDPGVKVVVGAYPEAVDNVVPPLMVGGCGYVFVHGHQFDRAFMGSQGGWRLLGHVRQFGAATGAYAWVFLLLAVIALLAGLAGGAALLGIATAVALVAVWFPRFYMKMGRRAWAALTGSRYDRAGMLNGFGTWWRDFHRSVGPAEELGVVFGHTHFLDWFDVPATERGATPEEQRLAAALHGMGRRRHTLTSVSSWVRVEGPHANLTRDTAFYVDAAGPMFLGWDWHAKRPFHIPLGFVRKLRLGQGLSEQELKVAEQLGWPEKLRAKWAAGGEAL